VYEFNTGDGDRGVSEPLKAKHRAQAKFDRLMILFNEVIQVFPGPYSGPRAGLILFEEFTRRSTRSLIAVERDLLRQSTRLLNARSKNALAAATSRLARSRKATVFPALSTAR